MLSQSIKNSKLALVNSQTGAIEWERFSRNRIVDMYLNDTEERLVLIIEETNSTKFIEYNLNYHRLFSKTGEKADTSEEYNGLFKEIVQARSLTYNYINNIILLLDNQHNFYTHPNNEQSIQELLTHRKDIALYHLNNESNTIICNKLEISGLRFVEVWNFSIIMTMEKIHAWERGQALNNLRNRVINVSNKRFSPITEGRDYLLLLASQSTGRKFSVYLINERHGAMESLIFIYEPIPIAKPIMKIYENIIMIILHYEDDTRDKVVIIELATSNEISGSENDEYKPVFITIAAKKEKLIPLNNYLQFNYRVFGITALYTNNTLYIAILDEEGNVHLMNINKLKKGYSYDGVPTLDDLLLKSSEKRFVQYPTEIIYSESKRQLIVAGGDIYSFTI